MGIDNQEVQRIAALAGLDPRPEDLEHLAAELDGILAQMELLADVPLDEADAHAAEGTAPLRADEPGRDELVRPVRELAPDWRAGFFTVPRLAALGEAASTDVADGGGEGGGEGR
jgi:aspartyl-tRNA(Asn)/glutamyl-tRNA(Gln) amidotransferase subunit C